MPSTLIFTSQRRLLVLINAVFNESSQPEFSISPIFDNWEDAKPALGGSVSGRRASLVIFLYEVKVTPILLSNKPKSKPNSVSVVVSGLSSALPGLSGVTPATFASTAVGVNVRNWS